MSVEGNGGWKVEFRCKFYLICNLFLCFLLSFLKWFFEGVEGDGWCGAHLSLPFLFIKVKIDFDTINAFILEYSSKRGIYASGYYTPIQN